MWVTTSAQLQCGHVAAEPAIDLALGCWTRVALALGGLQLRLHET